METVLSIGDGSNDVAMIRKANVGIGLYGKEGSEAASNSDYSIAEFRHLRRLLFAHGANFSYKMSYYTILYLFKTQMFCFIPFIYSFYAGFSGLQVWQDLFYTLF